MAHVCIVKCCSNNRTNVKGNTEHVSFFRLPHVEVMRLGWLERIGEVKMPSKIEHARICSAHFTEDSFVNRDSAVIETAKRCNRRRRLVRHAVPTLKLTEQEEVSANISQSRLNPTNSTELKIIRREFILPSTNPGSAVQHASNTLTVTPPIPIDSSTEAKEWIKYTPPADDMAYEVRAEATFPRRSERIADVAKRKRTEDHDAICSKKPRYQRKTTPRILNYNIPPDVRKCTSEEGTPAWKRRQRFMVENLDLDRTHSIVMPAEEDPAKRIIWLTEKINYLESLVNFYKSSKITDQEQIQQLDNQCAAYRLELKKERDEKEKLFLEIQDLRNLNDELYEKLKSAGIDQTKSKEELKMTIHRVLAPYFTEGQIRCITEGCKWVRWSVDDFAAAISLRSVSPKAYRYMRNKLNFPFPSLSSLRRWALSKFDISEGFLMDVLAVMREKSKSMTSLQKIAVVTFDEMALNQEMCFDSKLEKMIGPCAKVQVIMVRGLMGNWKQPIYYKFDQPMTKSILFEALSLLHQAGIEVVACTSDMGNRGVWGELGINISNHFFKHPTIPDAVVYVFADVPHLLKLLRNWYIDDGFNFPECNETFTRDVLQSIVTQSIPSDLCIAHRLTQRVLDARQCMRQAVWPAARIWSRSVAKAVEWMGQKNLLNLKEYEKLSDFILYVNDWFDVHNSQSMFGKHRGVNAYGTDVEYQKRILSLMTSYMERLRVGSRQKLMPFQEGIIISNASLRHLHEYLQKKFPNDYKYIITRRLQQDVLENFFSYIRAMGATRDHPSAYDFRYRLRWYILGKHSHAIFTNNRNTEEDMSASCISSSCSTSTPKQASTSSTSVTLYASGSGDLGYQTRYDVNNLLVNCHASSSTILSAANESLEPAYDYEPDSDAQIVLTEELFMNIINTSPNSTTEDTEDDVDSHENLDDKIDNNLHEIDEIAEVQNIKVACKESSSSLDESLEKNLIHNAGLAYIAGYVAHRYRTKYRFLGEPTSHFENSSSNDHSDWIQTISRGNLMQPSNALLDACKLMEKHFVQFHGDKFSRDVKVVQKVVQLVKDSKEYNNWLPEEVLQCLVRTRTYIRMREINKKMYVQKEKQKIDKKNKKFSKLPKVTLDAYSDDRTSTPIPQTVTKPKPARKVSTRTTRTKLDVPSADRDIHALIKLGKRGK